MKTNLRHTIAAACLGSCLLFAAGCTITLPPRLERDMTKVRLADEWNKIVQYAGIDGDQAMLGDFIVRCDASGTLASFRLKFFIKDGDSSYVLHSVNYSGSDEIKCAKDTVAEPIADAVRVNSVFAEIDSYGFANFGREIDGPIGMMMSTIWGKTNYRSDETRTVYLLREGEIELVENQAFELGKEYVALNVWAEGNDASEAKSIVFLIRDEATAETVLEPNINDISEPGTGE